MANKVEEVKSSQQYEDSRKIKWDFHRIDYVPEASKIEEVKNSK